MPFLRDEFEDTDGTLLANHAPDVGGAWAVRAWRLDGSDPNSDAVIQSNTLSDANVLGQSEPHPTLDGPEPSWVDRHQCDHEDDIRSGCVVMARSEGPS